MRETTRLRASARAPQWLLLLSGSCCALGSLNVWADESTAAMTVAANNYTSAMSGGGDVSHAADEAAAPARRRAGYTEVSSIALPAWDRPTSADAAQRAARGVNSNSFNNSFGNSTGSADMPPSRVEFSHWTHARGGAGVALGVVQPGSNNAAAALSGPAEVRDPNGSGSTSLELGLRWRGRIADQTRLDVGAWRRMSNNTPDAYTLTQTNDNALYAARVEVQFPSAKYGGLAPELGAVGVQMSGGGKVVLRAKRGGPMVYYRAKF